MTDQIQDDKPNCFGKLYDETDCVECIFKYECNDGTKLKPVMQLADDEDLEAAAAAALEAEEEVIELAKDIEAEVATDKEPVKEVNEAEKKATPEAKKEAKKKPVTKKNEVEVSNRQPFKTLMDSGKITPFVDETKKKTYMQVKDDGIHVYKSQIYHEKNLAEFANSGANPFKDGSIPAEAFKFLEKGDEVTFRDAFNHLKTAFPGKNDATLMNRAADVLSGAHFFGIAKVTRKVGRQKFFQMQ